MVQTFLTQVDILKVRHLSNIQIPLSKDTRKHLIITGKNASGKTSVLLQLVDFLSFVISKSFESEDELRNKLFSFRRELQRSDLSMKTHDSYIYAADECTKKLQHWTKGCIAECTSFGELRNAYRAGEFILAFYGDTRKIDVLSYKNIEKVHLQPVYSFDDKPSRNLAKYLVDLKSTQAFAQAKNDQKRTNEIEDWFVRFEGILRKIYQDDSLTLDFNIDTFQFSIHIDGREPFGFNTMSMGYAAVFDIISDLIMRMESKHRYDLEGIVLIDEIETHLHVDLQKQIVPILTELFPKLQFIMTTHSPFILNSAENAVVYDLENNTLVENGLTNLPYEGIVEGYFGVETLSDELHEKFSQYKALVQSETLSDADYAKIAELEYYLDEVPDYLAVDFSTEYAQLKLEFENRG
mgnify:CR=1 FL=1